MPERTSSPYATPRAHCSRAPARGPSMRARAAVGPLRFGPSRTCVPLLALPLCLLLLATPSHAGPGTGTAVILPPSAVVAGATGTWNVTYSADEDFSNLGGVIEVVIPPGWTL